MLLGHWIEMRSINQAQGALKELAKLLPDMAVRLDEAGATKEVPVAELTRGDLLLIRPGASIPADGVVKEGTSRSEEHTSELQSLMRISYAVFCLTKKHKN